LFLRRWPLRTCRWSSCIFALPLANIAACAYFVLSRARVRPGATSRSKPIDYSLFRAAKKILYIPFSFDVRYRAKEVIDVFGYRFGKGASRRCYSEWQALKMCACGLRADSIVSAGRGWLCGNLEGLFGGGRN